MGNTGIVVDAWLRFYKLVPTSFSVSWSLSLLASSWSIFSPSLFAVARPAVKLYASRPPFSICCFFDFHDGCDRAPSLDQPSAGDGDLPVVLGGTGKVEIG